jgi:gamma-glutamylcyclotransferase (GGCT)/AIG2-like uncharacterized protein YtfP
MPLIFAYGTLQDEKVQLKTLGRRLPGRKDELVGFERTSVRIEDPKVVAALGRTHFDNVEANGKDQSRVPGMVFELTDAELTRIDAYETAYSYKRVAAKLASGEPAWVYVCR